MSQKKLSSNVVVSTTARLHMGFFDLNGQKGRRFGSLGLSIDAPNTIIELAHSHYLLGDDAVDDYVQKSMHTLLKHANITEPVRVKVHTQIPRHSGLGSGTQMALAIGIGINALFDLKWTLPEIALIVGRGLRSGIGIGTFAQGGLVLDGGRGAQTKIPPIIAHQHFPKNWRILLIFDAGHTGLHGAAEQQAFSNLQMADQKSTDDIGQRILMQALPALVEEDLTAFGQAIAQLQAYTGDYFAPVQGGRYASPRVAQVLNALSGKGVACVGQTSWGPTGFAIFENQAIAEQYLTELKVAFTDAQLSWRICAANNAGASIQMNKV